MQNNIEAYIPQIKVLMLQYGVEKAYAFGSAARGTMQPNSDVDFVIRFPVNLDFHSYATQYFDLLDALKQLLHRDVDLLAEETITNPYLIENINQHKLAILWCLR